MHKKSTLGIGILCLLILIGWGLKGNAQNIDDVFMMNKYQTCDGLMASTSSFDHYWEGNLKRNNLNIGTVTSQSLAFMGVYGISDHFNILVGLPYIKTKASAGTLHGLEGVQDLSISLKYQGLDIKSGASEFRIFGVGGISVPASNYLADYLPLSIGLKSRTLSLRLLGDYQFRHFFFTGSFFYNLRSTIAIDRNSYYTTELHLTDQVSMPNVDGFTLRSGFRSTHLVLEAIFQNYNTLGGFDIRRNDNPFPSNRMNWTSLGMNIKYEFTKPLNGITIYGGGNYVLDGRNVGQSKTFDLGLFYAFYIHSHSKH